MKRRLTKDSQRFARGTIVDVMDREFTNRGKFGFKVRNGAMEDVVPAEVLEDVSHEEIVDHKSSQKMENFEGQKIKGLFKGGRLV